LQSGVVACLQGPTCGGVLALAYAGLANLTAGRA
jgi:hypothetical protein